MFCSKKRILSSEQKDIIKDCEKLKQQKKVSKDYFIDLLLLLAVIYLIYMFVRDGIV